MEAQTSSTTSSSIMLTSTSGTQQPAATANLPLGERYPLAANFAASAVSVSSGVALTNWIDVIKIRQQLAGTQGRNMVTTGVNIVKNEGFLALYTGVTPAVLRGISYGGLRIGLYAPFKSMLTKEGQDASLFSKISAGMASGAVAAGLCNPTDLVKTRLQSGSGSKLGPWAVTKLVVKEEGVVGLWKGTTPSMVCMKFSINIFVLLSRNRLFLKQ